MCKQLRVNKHQRAFPSLQVFAYTQCDAVFALAILIVVIHVYVSIITHYDNWCVKHLFGFL